MPVYIQNMTSEVNVNPGEMPLNERQMKAIIELTARRVREMLREEQQRRELNGFRRESAPGDAIDGG